jgi:hypothetical protein
MTCSAQHQLCHRLYQTIEDQQYYLACDRYLRQDNASNPLIGSNWTVHLQSLIEHRQLIDAIISNKGFPNKEHKIWGIVGDKFCQSFHKWLIVLHSSGCVDQDTVEVILSCIGLCGCCNTRGITRVAHLEQWDIKTF